MAFFLVCSLFSLIVAEPLESPKFASLTTLWPGEHTYPTHPMPVPSVTYPKSDDTSSSSSSDERSTSTVFVTVYASQEPLHTYSTHPMPVPSVTYPRSDDEGDVETKTETLVVTETNTQTVTVFETVHGVQEVAGDVTMMKSPDQSMATAETGSCHEG
ncbi:hypothetical protein CC79DRAFT_1399126 [Sarocladium strictum]